MLCRSSSGGWKETQIMTKWIFVHFDAFYINMDELILPFFPGKLLWPVSYVFHNDSLSLPVESLICTHIHILFLSLSLSLSLPHR